MNKEMLEDYYKLAGEITEKLDNTAEYENWLIIQNYFDVLLNELENKCWDEASVRADVLLEQVDYKSRIDKATKYLRSNEWAKDYENSNCRTHLLNILQGGDKE